VKSRSRLALLANLLLALAVAGAPALSRPAAAAADASKKTAARAHYEKGATEYNLGHFAGAITEFEQAYELDGAPILLFNIAQCHRQNGNVERAAFFYRRYLEQAPASTNRAEVEKRIKELDEMVRQQNDVKRRPPTEVTDHDGAGQGQGPGQAPAPGPANGAGAPTAPPAIAGGAPRDGTTPAATTTPVLSPAASDAQPGADLSRAGGGAAGELPHRIRVWASGGAAFPRFSGRDLNEPALLSLRAGGAYTLAALGPGKLDLGLSAAYAPVQYRSTDTNANHTSVFVGFLASATYRYRAAPALDVYGELGAGVLWWSGLGPANPFTIDGVGASGPVPMPSLLVGVGAAYHVMDRLFVFAEPAYLLSKTTGAGLTAAISSISRFDLALGVGYAL
jgi:tetratricopeptide (TPR) repeat protein